MAKAQGVQQNMAKLQSVKDCLKQSMGLVHETWDRLLCHDELKRLDIYEHLQSHAYHT